MGAEIRDGLSHCVPGEEAERDECWHLLNPLTFIQPGNDATHISGVPFLFSFKVVL